MGPANIAIVMAPVLMYSKVYDIQAASRQGTSNLIIQEIVEHYDTIFALDVRGTLR